MLEKETVADKITVLKENYPGVYMSYCTYYKMHKELDEYIDENLKLRDEGVHTFSLYVHGGLLPNFERLALAGKIK